MSNKICYFDFETKSTIDLKKAGASIYAEHESTDILCLGYMLHDNQKPIILINSDLNNNLLVLKTIANMSEYTFCSHNNFFDRTIWNNVLHKRYGFPYLPIERCKDTMAKAYAHGLPGSLEDVAEVLQLPIQKDMFGRDNMLSLSKPIPERKVTYTNAKRLAKKYGLDLSDVKPKNWEEHAQRADILELFTRKDFWTPEEQPEKFQKLYEYCQTDVEVCRQIDERLPDLSEFEQKLWFIDQEINQNGIYVDRPLIEKSVKLLEQHDANLLGEFFLKTNGLVESPRQRGKLLDYLNSNGLNIENTQKQTVALLEHSDPNVSRVLEITKELSRSSVAKYQSMLDRSTSSGLVRELVQYHAAHTGRFGGRGIQIQNFPRTSSTIPYTDLYTKTYTELVQAYPKLIDALSTNLRGMIIPKKGNVFFIGDFAQMEARVLAWLTGEEKVLEVFRQGKDIYCAAASELFGFEVTKDHKFERQVGKVLILAFGYGGGIGACQTMSKANNVDLSVLAPRILEMATFKELENAQKAYDRYVERSNGNAEQLPEDAALAADILKQRWRKSNPNIVNYWKKLEQDIIEAMNFGSSPDGTWFVEDIFLKTKLPSSRIMCYPYPTLDGNKLSYYSTLGRETTYGGKLAENITQAVQRDLLAEAIVRLDDFKFIIRAHIHDELVCENESGSFTSSSFAMFQRVMAENTLWCPDLPIDVDAKIAERYEK